MRVTATAGRQRQHAKLVPRDVVSRVNHSHATAGHPTKQRNQVVKRAFVLCVLAVASACAEPDLRQGRDEIIGGFPARSSR